MGGDCGIDQIAAQAHDDRLDTKRRAHREPSAPASVTTSGLKLAPLEQVRPLMSVGGNWNVAQKVHPVVQNADDFDRALRRCAIHEEVTSTATAPRHVERAKAGHDFVPGLRPSDTRTIAKLGDRQNERVAIDARLSRAKILSGPFEDVREVEFRGGAETDAPFSFGHAGSIRRFWK
jgi:hypothetical protein